ncbi:MAG: hypothetical protein LBS16_07760 [Prevotellaceae bacterium]|jgi:hypothetical protein|nr:hypothetical protein [Prevotellaceae bacterium]
MAKRKTIHIGEIICQKLKAEGRTKKWLAEQVHCHPSNFCRLLQKPTMVGFSGKDLKLACQEAGLTLVKRIKRYDYMWWRTFERKKRLPLLFIAPLLYLIDLIGWGTNREIVLRK